VLFKFSNKQFTAQQRFIIKNLAHLNIIRARPTCSQKTKCLHLRNPLLWRPHLKLTIKLPIVFSLRAKPQLIEEPQVVFHVGHFAFNYTLTSAERRRSKEVSLGIIKAHTHRVKHRHINESITPSIFRTDNLKKGCMCEKERVHFWSFACSRASDCAPRLIFMIPQKSNYLCIPNNQNNTREKEMRCSHVQQKLTLFCMFI